MNTEKQRTSLPPVPPPVRRPAHRAAKMKANIVRHVPRARKHAVRHKKIRRELSAGGVAVRKDRGLWLVALLKTEHRRGQVWVLPKGHVEIDRKERVDEAARREVQEEVGIADLVVKEQLGTTQFVFQAEDVLVKKTVHYYLMVTEQAELKPQEEEGFVEAKWFPISVAITMLEYDTDQDIVAKAQVILEGKTTFVPKKHTSQKSIKIHS
ncbi:MAG TPA: NUDIX hydrolase [Candidatus Andersenbacteria bacterium]|nr:NUDIX hydrolase [Candidatus Andersenbacteria bacterium]